MKKSHLYIDAELVNKMKKNCYSITSSVESFLKDVIDWRVFIENWHRYSTETPMSHQEETKFVLDNKPSETNIGKALQNFTPVDEVVTWTYGELEDEDEDEDEEAEVDEDPEDDRPEWARAKIYTYNDRSYRWTDSDSDLKANITSALKNGLDSIEENWEWYNYDTIILPIFKTIAWESDLTFSTEWFKEKFIEDTSRDCLYNYLKWNKKPECVKSIFSIFKQAMKCMKACDKSEKHGMLPREIK